jgi:hypothetical protein
MSPVMPPRNAALERALVEKMSIARVQSPKDMNGLIVHQGTGPLGSLAEFSSLFGLSVEYWTSFAPLGEVGPDLASLEFRSVDLDDLSWIANANWLKWLELSYTLVTDLRPLLDHPGLVDFKFKGCPIDEHSWYEVLPKIEAFDGHTPYFPESAWKLCRTLHEAGLPVVASVDDFGELRLNQPGWHVAKGLLSIPADEVLAALAAHTRIDLPTFVNETRVRRGEQPLTLEQMYPEPKFPSDPPGGPPA